MVSREEKQHRSNPFQRAHFLLGAHSLRQLPPDEGDEVAFAGRSNAGKSSALNAIAGSRSLARTSKTPGRTQQINFFGLDDTRRLVDLPGYGYAKVPEAMRRHWEQTLGRFLRERRALRGLVLVMDIRHPLTEYDRQMLGWCEGAGMPVHVLLTKADKLKRGPALDTLKRVKQALSQAEQRVTVQLFSALKGTGVEQAREQLEAWLRLPGEPQQPAPAG